MRRRTAIGALAAVTVLWLAMFAAPAGAEVIEGPCTGFAEFSNGTRVTESTPLSVTNEVPAKDTVAYAGDTTLSPPGEPESFSGNVSVRLPLGGSWVVADWPDNPDDTTEQTSATGSYAYEVPTWVPKGTGGLEVTATHTQRGQTCTVAVVMTVEGDPGPAAILGAAGSAMFAAGLIGAGFKRKVA